MKTISTLFIGGSHDGQWYPVSLDADEVAVQRRGGNVEAASLMGALFGMSAAGADGMEVYRRFLITGNSQRFCVFALERMSVDEVFAWLIGGYSPLEEGCEGCAGGGSEEDAA